MPTSKWIAIFYSRVFCDIMSYSNERKMGTSVTQHIWCKDSELAPSQVAPDLDATPPQQHCAICGASTILINEICRCLIIMLSESTLSCFLHAFYEINSTSKLGFLPLETCQSCLDLIGLDLFVFWLGLDQLCRSAGQTPKYSKLIACNAR